MICSNRGNCGSLGERRVVATCAVRFFATPRNSLLFALWFLLGGACWAGAAGEWKLALPDWVYEFPRDHHWHEGFKTEWWYFTGNLQSEDGEDFGYQLTFFRQGIMTDLPEGVRSRFAVRDLAFAHFAVSRLDIGEYRHFSRWNRGAFGEAGFGRENVMAWIQDWEVENLEPGVFRLQAVEEGIEIALELRTAKPPVFHGKDGVSQKAEGEGRASHYYSFTRLLTTGVVRWEGREFAVRGTSWYDHEWATNQLTEEQEGWDWFSLQFDDGTELMLFQIRLRDGGRDPFSSGTFVDAEGVATPVGVEDFTLEPGRTWVSKATGGAYPVEWRIGIPKLGLELEVASRLDAQEFTEPPIFYWEGAMRARGTRDGQPVTAVGFLEMTGYGSPIVGMQAPVPATNDQ
jgi:predicted secreted hydrolase